MEIQWNLGLLTFLLILGTFIMVLGEIVGWWQ